MTQEKPDITPEAHRQVCEVCEEAVENRPKFGDRIKLSDCNTWTALLKSDKANQVDVTMASLFFDWPEQWNGGDYQHKPDYQYKSALEAVAHQLLRRKLPFTADHLAAVAHKLTEVKEGRVNKVFYFHNSPLANFLSACERLCGKDAPPEPLLSALQALQAHHFPEGETVGSYMAKSYMRLMELLDRE